MSDREADILALSHWRDRQFADWFVTAFALAVETHPEVIRKALSNVFDLSAVQDAMNRQMVSLAGIQQQTGETREQIAQAVKEIEELRSRLFRIQEWLSKRAKEIQARQAQPTARK